MSYIKRESNIISILKENESVFLFGPRGTGKSQIIQKILSNQQYFLKIDLLNQKEFLRFLTSPDLLISEVKSAIPSSGKLFVAIDEVQRVPHLLNNVHSLIEEFRNKVQFILTGSSARKLKREGVNLLAGRAITLHLHPLSIREVNLDLKKALTTGTLPYAYVAAKNPKYFLKSYVETYLKEEIQQEALVRNLDAFVRFLELSGQYNAEPINFSKLGKQLSINYTTVENYFSILVDTLIVFRLPGYAQSVKKQLLQAPKYYFFDCGVLNSINGELSTELRASSFRYGKLFETFVINEVFRINEYKELDLKFHYWRTSLGKEVDLVLSRNALTPPVAIEIKSAEKPMLEDVSGLLSFAEEHPKSDLLCFCQTPRKYKLGPVTFVPWQVGINNLTQY